MTSDHGDGHIDVLELLGDIDVLELLGDLQEGVDLLARAMGKLTAQLDRQARDDVHPPVLVIGTGVSALRQALDRQTRGSGG